VRDLGALGGKLK